MASPSETPAAPRAGDWEDGRISPHPPLAALCLRGSQPRQGGGAQCRRRHHRLRHGQSRHADARPYHRQAERDGRASRAPTAIPPPGASRAAPGPGRLLRAPLRGEAQSRHRDRQHAGLQGRLRQSRAGDHRAGRCRAGAQSGLSDPCLRLHDGGRRDPSCAGRPTPEYLRGARARAACIRCRSRWRWW